MTRIARTCWTPEQIAFLQAHYADHKSTWIAEQLGIKIGPVYHKAHALGLKKSHTFLASEASGRLNERHHKGIMTRFQPGITPWNKGTNYIAGGRSAETRFKKGERSGRSAELWKPIGTERITDDGYLQRKMTDTGVTRRDYVPVHHLLWIEANGPIPPGHALVFRDGDRRNITLANLELVTRAELMRRNTRHNLPKELNELVQLRSVISRRINKLEKETA